MKAWISVISAIIDGSVFIMLLNFLFKIVILLTLSWHVRDNDCWYGRGNARPSGPETLLKRDSNTGAFV